MKKLGVIGGLGPMATAYFMELVIKATDAKTDQDNIEMLIHSCPGIPDRTSFILGKSNANPGPEMIAVGKGLERMGAEVIAIPCVTAGYFFDSISEELSVQVIDILEETALYLEKLGVKQAGIMATDGTVESGLFQKAFAKHGIEAIIPKKDMQAKVVHIIYEDVKANKPVEMELFEAVGRSLTDAGAQVIILGCTELSMAKKENKLEDKYIDVMEILARKSVELCKTTY